MKRFLRFLWPLAFMAALFLASSVPGEVSGREPGAATRWLALVAPAFQNLLHVPAFGALAWLWLRALAPLCSRPVTLAAAVALTLGYAVLDESYQAHVPGRYASATDLAADALGAVLAAALYAACHDRSRR